MVKFHFTLLKLSCLLSYVFIFLFPGDMGEEMRIREKLREKERCRQRDEVRRDKCARGSRSNHQVRAKEANYGRHESSRHSPLSPNYHHHYRGSVQLLTFEIECRTFSF